MRCSKSVKSFAHIFARAEVINTGDIPMYFRRNLKLSAQLSRKQLKDNLDIGALKRWWHIASVFSDVKYIRLYFYDCTEHLLGNKVQCESPGNFLGTQ